MQAWNFYETTSSITPTFQQVVTQTATPVVEVVLGVAAAAAPCDLAVLVEETVRCLTGTTEGAAGVEGAVTAGTELLPPVSTSTRLTGKTNGFMYMKHASSEIKVKSSNNENS